jgi:hypothetical protein
MAKIRVYRHVKYIANYDAKVFIPIAPLKPSRTIGIYDTEFAIQLAIDVHLNHVMAQLSHDCYKFMADGAT